MYKNTKLCSVISYITWVGFIIAFLIRDQEDEMVKHHLNQALLLNIASTIVSILSRIKFLGMICGLVNLAILVLAIMGIIRALKLSDQPLPLIGEIKLL